MTCFCPLPLCESGDAFLGTQGYVWDTQSDMLMALVGAVAFLVTCSRAHDRQLVRFVNER